MKKRKVSKIKIKLKAIKNKKRIIEGHLKDDFEFKKFTNQILKKPKRFFYRLKNSKNRFKDIIRFILGSRLSIILLILIMYIKTNIFYRNIQMDELYMQFLTVFFYCYTLVLVIPLFFIRKNKNRFRFMMFYNIFYSVLLFADNLYWEYSSSFISISQIAYLKYAEEIGSTITHLIKLSHFKYFLDIPIILILWHIVVMPTKKNKSNFAKNRGKRKLVSALVYTVIITSVARVPITFIYLSIKERPYNKMMQVELGTIFGYHYYDIYNAIHAKDMVKYKDYESMMESYENISKYKKEHFKEEDIYGIAKDKNVIVIQLESVQNFMRNKMINGKEIMPNLNKFLDENIELSQMICQSYTTTADSEYTAITSLYPLENGQAFSGYSASINNDIFKQYKNAGYNTYYMHGNVGGFWNRRSVFDRLDIDKISFIDDFHDTSEKINGYLSDELFYKQSVKKLEENNKPFFAFLTAASSHTPFELVGIKDKNSKVNIDVRKI